MFKLIFKLIVFSALVASCSNIERDNPLDPKNPDSISETPILIEAFINTTFDYDNRAIEGLDQIKAQFGDNLKFEIVEYHRANQNWPASSDPFENPEFTPLHKTYADTYEDGSIAVPDIYINGSEGRVLGASDAESVYDRLASILTDIGVQQSNYLLEIDLSVSGTLVNVNYRVARLGDQTDENLELHIIFIENDNNTGFRPVARKITYPNVELINKLNAGEYAEGNINNISCPNHPDYAIFTITKQDDITVLKTLKKEILW